MPDEHLELTLYVQSKRVVTTFYRTSATSPAGPATTTPVMGAPPHNQNEPGVVAGDAILFLSDDQSRCVALTEELAVRRGYHVHVVDIEKVGRLERLVAEHLRGVQTFPVLISPLGSRLEGAAQFTEDNLAAMMPTELKHVRAFTYLKIRGGDLDRIRRLLETFPEVKELHFLTGDWDMLAVLQFPPSASNKRMVLDFVTERIRGIAEVLDTSTVVPEYTVTKLPITS
ncbi:MAG TPA: Lrp/AsnC ligand binding domain-containing protein [Thermoplasmata archaeon]|nr:Lrp/AsnC ligand binding domain-containing protein [Thermoplasmata archaeon]